MITLQKLTELLGWSSIINMVFLLLALVLLTTMKDRLVAIHKRMFRLSDEDLSRAYFQYLGQYKMLIFVFNLVPYVALKIMGQ